MKRPATFPFVAAQSGIYIEPAAVSSLKQSALTAGLVWFELDLAGIADKPGFLAGCQAALGLPSSFGRNWDALADSLADFSWRPARGYVVAIRNGGAFARRSPQDYATALEILAAAARYWATKDRVFLVLIDAGSRGGRVFEPLPA
jgi:hypothetical protein